MSLYNESSHSYHSDHLGSKAMVTDVEGRITQNVAYIPFGEVFVEERDGNCSTPYLFNAKEMDSETGLYYYGARYLDPTAAMWMTVDPLFEKYPGMSPYNYCAGNPVKLVDPDGRTIEDEDSKERADRIQDDILSRLGDVMVELRSENLKASRKNDLEAVRDELCQSFFDIEDMRKDPDHNYSYKDAQESPDHLPQFDCFTDPKNPILYVELVFGSEEHEGRHGGDYARGILTPENYCVTHEIRAYRAQYAFVGEYSYDDNPTIEVLNQRTNERMGTPDSKYEPNKDIVRNIKEINIWLKVFIVEVNPYILQ